MESEVTQHQKISWEFHEPFSTEEFDAEISKIFDEN